MEQTRFSANTLIRRDLLKSTAVAIAALAMLSTTRDEVLAEVSLENVALPPDIGQTEFQAFVPETGHTIRGTFLDYWRANGAAHMFGNPISEPFAAPNGYYSQAFERGILQFLPEYLWSDEPIVRLMPIYRSPDAPRASRLMRTGRRYDGGGQRRSKVWIALSPESQTVQRAIDDGGIYFEDTGHTLKGAFLEWFREHEGDFYLGHPVTEAYTDRGRWTQYFDGGKLVSSEDEIRLDVLPATVIRALGVDTTPVSQENLPLFDELLFWTADNPNPLAAASTPGRKWIEISISQQQLWAYHGGTPISSTLVSTGLSPNDTEQGVFRIRLKYPLQDMQGFTNESGEVLGFGEDAPDGTIPYGVKDVPHVMYFNLDAEALHGAYWHNSFGTPMSHGCVNLPLDMAAFLYGWAPLGTQVWVHE